MARYADMLSDVVPWVPECPNRSIEEYLRRATIEFCRRSGFWREPVVIPLEDDRLEYRVRSVRPDGRMDRPLKAIFKTDPTGNGSAKNRVLKHIGFGDARLARSSGRGDPAAYGVDETGANVRIWPTPLVSNQDNPRIELYAVAVPTQRSTQFADQIFEQWREAIVDGCLWHLMRMPGKSWSNPEMALHHRAEFYRQVNDARRKMETDNWAPTRTRMRPWV